MLHVFHIHLALFLRNGNIEENANFSAALNRGILVLSIYNIAVPCHA